MADSQVTQRRAAERWFLAQGLPAVLRPGALLRHVWSRSAPALAGYAVITANSILVVAITGRHTIDINGNPTRTEWFVLAALVLLFPVATAVGWLVSRITAPLRRVLVANASIAIMVIGAIYGGPSPRALANLVTSATIVLAIVVLTISGAGSILSWAAHATLSNLAQTAGMFVRALPVVLLTVLVFFNTYVWLMAAVVSRARLWLALIFLFLIAAAFLLSSTLDRVRPILSASDPMPEDPARLAATPFANMPDDHGSDPLSRSERANVVFIVAASQLGQVLTVSLLTGGIYFILGLILISPRLLESWTRGDGTPDGHILGMTLPVPEALIQTSMFLTALTFMYLAAKAVDDKEYRAQFVDPLVDDVRLTLVARDRYRSALRQELEDHHG